MCPLSRSTALPHAGHARDVFCRSWGDPQIGIAGRPSASSPDDDSPACCMGRRTHPDAQLPALILPDRLCSINARDPSPDAMLSSRWQPAKASRSPAEAFRQGFCRHDLSQGQKGMRSGRKECGAADGAAALRPLPLRKNAARAGPKIARLPHDLHPEPGEARRESGGAGGLGVPGPWTGNCLESAAFAPGRRTGRGLPIPASETEPCRGMPKRGPFAFSIPSPLMSASRASCGGRGGRAGAFLRPPTPPPGPSPGVSRGIPGEATRIRPPRPDSAFRPRPFAGIPGNPRLSPDRPAACSRTLQSGKSQRRSQIC